MISEKGDIIEKILEFELKMFLTVPTQQKSSCQDYPDSFRMHRKAQFNAWSDDTLNSYLNDLESADKEGRNIMTHKYARMDNLVPSQNNNPLIKEITGIQFNWQKEMFDKYPNMMKRARPISTEEDTTYRTSFETYLAGEIETYSNETINLLHRDISDKLKGGINMAEEIYEFLVKENGYESLKEAEEYAKQNG